MPVYQYNSVDKSGTNANGEIEAIDRKAAVTALSARGLCATSITEKVQGSIKAAHEPANSKVAANGNPANGKQNAGKSSPAQTSTYTGPGKMTRHELLDFTSQLYTAMKSGLPLMKCLEIIEKQMPRPASRQVVSELLKAVNGGRSLSQAIKESSHKFPPLYSAMIAAGETGGILEKTTAQLRALLKREDKLISEIKTAMWYPLSLLGLGLLSVILLITVVLPQIVNSLADDPEMLPLPTKILMDMSEFIASYAGLAVFVLLVAGGFALARWFKTPDGRMKRDTALLKLPMIGSVFKSVSIGRFCRTFGSMLSGGVVVLDALTVVKETLGNAALSKKIEHVIERVKTGSSLAEPLEESGDMPLLLIQIVAVGEQTGALDEMLLEAGATFEEKADAAIERFTNVLPTVIILLLAVLIGFIVAATLLPILASDFGTGV